VVLLSIIASWPLFRGIVDSQPPVPVVSPPIRCPDNYSPPAVASVAAQLAGAEVNGLQAVAIVGDWGGGTATLKNDMNSAVSALEAHGVSVTKFYFGESSFTWSDIVAAAQDAHFVLYMGHGVAWEQLLGGFHLGDSDNDGTEDFVSPNQIRSGLGGTVANDCIGILSHACFSAGASISDPPGLS